MKENKDNTGSAVSTAVGEPVATAASAAKPAGSIGDYAQFHTLLQACYEACEVLDKATGREVLDAADKLTDAQNRLVEYINTSSARLAAPTQAKPVASAFYWSVTGSSGWDFKWLGSKPEHATRVDLFAAPTQVSAPQADWRKAERDAYIDAMWPAPKQGAANTELRPVGSIGDYAQFHTHLGAFAEAYKGLDEACGKDVFEAVDNLTSAQNSLIEYINDWPTRSVAPVATNDFDQATLMQLVREFAEVVYGQRRTTEDVGKKLVDYVRGIATKAGSAQPEQASAAQEVRAVPDDVHRALDRMCTPLDESRLSGATAAEDARCMQIIRRHIEGTSTAPAAMNEKGGA